MALGKIVRPWAYQRGKMASFVRGACSMCGGGVGFNPQVRCNECLSCGNRWTSELQTAEDLTSIEHEIKKYQEGGGAVPISVYRKGAECMLDAALGRIVKLESDKSPRGTKMTEPGAGACCGCGLSLTYDRSKSAFACSAGHVYCLPGPGCGSGSVIAEKMLAKNDILDEARSIVSGARQAAYGPPEYNFSNIGEKWAATLRAAGWLPNAPIPPRIVALMMIDLKVCRDAYQPKRDNLVDIAGYAYAVELFTPETIPGKE